MADIFISYKRENVEAAHALATAANNAGLTTFFDQAIPVGDRWDSFIERELVGASAVVVLWSKLSVDSRWVRLEARHGLSRGILVPALLEYCELPLEFSDIQAAKLFDTRLGSDEVLSLLKRTQDVISAGSSRSNANASTLGGPLSIHPWRKFRTSQFIDEAAQLCDSLSALLVADQLLSAELLRQFSRLKATIGKIEGAASSECDFIGDLVDGLKQTVWSCDAVFATSSFNETSARKLLPIVDEAAYQANACLQFLETPSLSEHDVRTRQPSSSGRKKQRKVRTD